MNDFCSAPAILTCDGDDVVTGCHRGCKKSKTPVRGDVGHRLSVDQESGTGLGAAADFHHFALKFDGIDLQKHALLFVLLDDGKFVGGSGFARSALGIDGFDGPEIFSGIEAGDFDGCVRCFFIGQDARKHRSIANLQFVLASGTHRLPLEANRRQFRIGHNDGLQIHRLNEAGRREDIGFGDGAARSERGALPLGDFNALVATLNFGVAGGNGNFILLRSGIRFHGRAAVLMKNGLGVGEGNLGFGAGDLPRAGGEVNGAGADVHADTGGAVAWNKDFLDGDERLRLDSVGRAIGEGEARNTIGAGLNQIALFQGHLVIGVYPLHGIHFFHLDSAVEIDEAGAANAGGSGAGVLRFESLADVAQDSGKGIRKDEVSGGGEHHQENENIEKNAAVGD